MGAAQGRRLPGIDGGAREPRPGDRTRVRAPALRRPDPGARPADRLRRGEPGLALRAQLVRLRAARFRPVPDRRLRPGRRRRGLALWPGSDARPAGRPPGRRRPRRLPAWAAGLAPGEAPPWPATPRPRPWARRTRDRRALAAVGGGRAGPLSARRPDPPPAAASARPAARGDGPPPPTVCWRASATSPTSSARRWPPPPWPCWPTRASPPCSAPARGPRRPSPGGAAARLPPGLAISGRVDRLVVEADRVLVVDFKTNRPAPAPHRGRRPGLHPPDGGLRRRAGRGLPWPHHRGGPGVDRRTEADADPRKHDGAQALAGCGAEPFDNTKVGAPSRYGDRRGR